MRKTLIAALMLIGTVATAATDAPMEEVVVAGEYAGPGMWQVTHPGHPGHTLWIVGDPPPLPQGIRFRSQQVTRVASQSQEILMPPGSSLQPAGKIGVFRMLTLLPAALKLRKNPDKATLRDLIPPDVHARWLVQKKLYLGRDSGVEKMRPFLVAEKLRDAAIKKLELGYGSWADVWTIVNEQKIPVTRPTLEFTFQTEGLRQQIKSLAREKLDDVECFSKTVEWVEALSNKEVENERARAWATGDLARLEALPALPDPAPSCDQAIVDALAMATPVPADLGERMDELWFDAAGKAMAKNVSTLAFVPMSTLLGAQGYLEGLRSAGYGILPPP
jgi:hypothetical protein